MARATFSAAPFRSSIGRVGQDARVVVQEAVTRARDKEATRTYSLSLIVAGKSHTCEIDLGLVTKLAE